MEKLNKRDVFLSLLLVATLLISGLSSYNLAITIQNQQDIIENQAIISEKLVSVNDNQETLSLQLSSVNDNQETLSLQLSSVQEAQLVIAEQMDVLAENDMAIASHLDALTDYLGKISGELLETEATEIGFDIHVEMLHHRNGILIGYSHHAGVLTTQGADYIEEALGTNASSLLVIWVGLSNDAGAPSDAWSVIPAEITTGNMSRSEGTYQSLGTGNWRIQFIFSPTGSGNFQLVGLYWSLYPEATLMASDQVTATSYESTDTVTIRFDITIA